MTGRMLDFLRMNKFSAFIDKFAKNKTNSDVDTLIVVSFLAVISLSLAVKI